MELTGMVYAAILGTLVFITTVQNCRFESFPSCNPNQVPFTSKSDVGVDTCKGDCNDGTIDTQNDKCSAFIHFFWNGQSSCYYYSNIFAYDDLCQTNPAPNKTLYVQRCSEETSNLLVISSQEGLIPTTSIIPDLITVTFTSTINVTVTELSCSTTDLPEISPFVDPTAYNTCPSSTFCPTRPTSISTTTEYLTAPIYITTCLPSSSQVATNPLTTSVQSTDSRHSTPDLVPNTCSSQVPCPSATLLVSTETLYLTSSVYNVVTSTLTALMTSCADVSPSFLPAVVTDDLSSLLPSTSVSQLSTETITTTDPVTSSTQRSASTSTTVGVTYPKTLHSLKLDRKSLSSYRRSLSSAEDNRTTPRAFAGCGITFWVIVFVLLVISDLLNLGRARRPNIKTTQRK